MNPPIKLIKRSLHALLLGLTLIHSDVHAAEDPVPSRVVPYKQVGNSALHLHVFNPAGHSEEDHSPAIVFFFGGGWNGGTPRQFYPQSAYLASRGMVAICAEYRTRNSHQTTPRACVEDGKSAMRWVRYHADALGIDPNKIAAGGGSAGGHVAAATAAIKGFNAALDPDVDAMRQALILFNPVYDNGPDGYGYERVKDYWEKFSPMHNLHADVPPTIVFLGTEDSLIPVETGQSFQSRMQRLNLRSELVLYEKEGHGFFNKKKFNETLFETDRFLTSLGFLKGKPTIESTTHQPPR